MTKGARELELKLETDADAAEALGSHPLLKDVPSRARRAVSIYYDTGNAALRAAGLTLRVRQADGRHVQTLKGSRKGAAGLHDRTEWEWPVDGPEPDVGLAADTPLAGLLAGPADALRAAFRTIMIRRSWEVDHHGGRIEVIHDRARVIADGRRQSFAEVELELLGGQQDALFAMARALHASVPLRLGVLTKSDRGRLMLGGRVDAVVRGQRAGDLACAPGDPSWPAVALACLRHFRCNEPLLAQRSPPALRECRIALRRLGLALRSAAGPDAARFQRAIGDAERLLASGHWERVGHLLDQRAFQATMIDILHWIVCEQSSEPVAA
ncbi:CYTH domain-containing protein [Sphingomonas sp. LY54]|uniref:CYTH domain-containing protein n=1 Tax=Sphingomonas sp. LY54 TaxID=3095343 RepID=UPI002D784913|nr:CYTH domain-containing protein [Sphingomonas sp. LY54]WRP29310.1 CYTH domain-containing protein [Sphingomonas sp. LY54]